LPVASSYTGLANRPAVCLHRRVLPATEIKRLQRLRDDDRARRDARVFIVEGDKAVHEFLRERRFEMTLYATAAWQEALPAPQREWTATEVTPAEMKRISHLPSPSTVLAVVHAPAPTALDSSRLANGYALALDAVQDPGNVGTILRIADWFGFGQVLLGEGCADAYSQKVVNASKGSLARVAVHRVDLPQTLSTAGVPILGCDLAGENVHTFAPPPAAIIVIGGEGRGLSPAVQRCVTTLLTVPSYGGAESLNAAFAAAIVCDNLRRLRPA
jgi:TrmH family RNA methyltransferase